ncbi:hypothetical protein AGLY_006323 [Aphis glycines]|uniref:Uncharacterized protein n=1 Tax=Aphis glycines TaxID=307491 RepID=A0A6G0TQQ0_APHGL|nr:hypothetical protein AGLY_006323 [Aphis glycines]
MNLKLKTSITQTFIKGNVRTECKKKLNQYWICKSLKHRPAECKISLLCYARIDFSLNYKIRILDERRRLVLTFRLAILSLIKSLSYVLNKVKRRLTIRKLCDSTITTINEYIKVIIIISQAHTDIGVKYKSMKCQCSEDSNSTNYNILKILHCSFGIWTFSQNTIRENVRLGISVRRKRWVISLIITIEHDNYIDKHLNIYLRCITRCRYINYTCSFIRDMTKCILNPVKFKKIPIVHNQFIFIFIGLTTFSSINAPWIVLSLDKTTKS